MAKSTKITPLEAQERKDNIVLFIRDQLYSLKKTITVREVFDKKRFPIHTLKMDQIRNVINALHKDGFLERIGESRAEYRYSLSDKGKRYAAALQEVHNIRNDIEAPTQQHPTADGMLEVFHNHLGQDKKL